MMAELSPQVATFSGLFTPLFNQHHDHRHVTDVSYVSVEDCAIYPTRPRFETPPTTDEKSLQLLNQTLFTVLTCKKYHATRLPVIQKTWGRLANRLLFVSDHGDPEFKTIWSEYGNQVGNGRKIIIISGINRN